MTKNNGQLGKIESFIGTQKQATQKFSYDSIGRLSDAKEYKGTDNSLTYKEYFDFDRFGNLYRKAINNSTTGQSNPVAYTPIEETQIDKKTNRFTTATNTTYNEAGMVVADNKFRSMGFSYDANGRQVKATKANVADAWSVYDALGNRVATKVNDIWQFVIYDAFGKLVAEYGTQGEGLGGVSYVLQDWQGSVRASVNNNGFIQARFDFTAFGEEVSLGVGLRSLEQGYTGDATTKQGYGLTEKDSSGQNHTWFRKQEQRAGRWTSPDPYNGSMDVDNPQSFNRFSYVENNAVNAVDPTGLQLIAFFYPTNCRWILGEYFVCDTGVYFMYIPDGGGSSGGDGGGGSSQQQDPPKKKKECSVKPLTKITDSVAKQFESGGGNQVDSENLTKETRASLSCMKNSIGKSGGSVTLNSGYRPQAYQNHLREVWDKAQSLKNNDEPECAKLKKQVQAELDRHTIKEQPAKSSNHTRGTAFDVNFSKGVTSSQISDAAGKCGLSRGKGHGGGHHFNFVGRK